MSSNEAGTEHDLGIDRRTVLRKGAVSAGGLALGTTVFVTSAGADQWDKRVDQTGVEFNNPCTGETMTATSGAAFFDVDVRSDASGGFHVNSRIRAKLKLEGNDTGIEYENTGTFNKSLYVDEDSRPFTFSSTGNLDFTSHGPAPDFRTRFRSQITVQANGDLAVTIDYTALKCLG